MSASARKTNPAPLTRSTCSLPGCLKLPASAVRLRKSGIEFSSQRPLAPWTEMTVSLEIPHERHVVHCTGIIVDSKAHSEGGYTVSMLFTDLSPTSQARLKSLARSYA